MAYGGKIKNQKKKKKRVRVRVRVRNSFIITEEKVFHYKDLTFVARLLLLLLMTSSLIGWWKFMVHLFTVSFFVSLLHNENSFSIFFFFFLNWFSWIGFNDCFIENESSIKRMLCNVRVLLMSLARPELVFLFQCWARGFFSVRWISKQGYMKFDHLCWPMPLYIFPDTKWLVIEKMCRARGAIVSRAPITNYKAWKTLINNR